VSKSTGYVSVLIQAVLLSALVLCGWGVAFDGFAFGKTTTKPSAPQITSVAATAQGYEIKGRGFGRSSRTVKVLENNKALPAKALQSVADTRIMVASPTTGRISVKVVVAGRASQAVAFLRKPPVPALVRHEESRVSDQFVPGRHRPSRMAGINRPIAKPSPMSGAESADSLLAMQMKLQLQDPLQEWEDKSEAERAAMAADKAEEMYRAGRSSQEIAREMKEEYDLSLVQTLKILLLVGFVLIVVVSAVVPLFYLVALPGATVLLAALLATGITLSSEEIGDALKAEFNLNIFQMTEIFQQKGMSVDETARMLKHTYNATGQAAAAALTQAGYTAIETASQLKTLFNATGENAAKWLQQAGVDATSTAEALIAAYSVSGETIVKWLINAGYSASDAAGAVVAKLAATGKQVATWLKKAGVSAKKTAQALKAKVADSGKKVLRWLREAGYTRTPVVRAIRDVFSSNSTAIAKWMREAGYSWTQVAYGIFEDLGRTATETARALFNAGLTNLESLVNILVNVANISIVTAWEIINNL
jgi:hypothetical protein